MLFVSNLLVFLFNIDNVFIDRNDREVLTIEASTSSGASGEETPIHTGTDLP